MRFGYNEEAELHTATDRTYQPFIYEYENHLMTKETNRNKLSFYFEYEGAGTSARCVHTWGDGNIYERWLEYLPKTRITKVKEGTGAETVYHYNELDLITKIFNAEGGIYQFEYGEFGELLKERDEVGRIWTYSYDEQLNRASVVQPDGAKLQIVFDENCLPVNYIDEVGGEWIEERDAAGNLIAAITPLQARREYEYNRFGDLVKYRDALGNETNLEWTENGLISTVVKPLGGKTTYLRNERGFIEEVINDFTKLRYRYAYDDAGRIRRISEINLRGETLSVEKFEYDNQNNLVSYIDAPGNKTVYKYTGLDKIRRKNKCFGRHEKIQLRHRRARYRTCQRTRRKSFFRIRSARPHHFRNGI